MKRFLAVLLVILLAFPVSIASATSEMPRNAKDIDLSNMSFGQLVILKNLINKAMWESREWQEVTVPQGVWRVGEDIPAGHWTVKCSSGASYSSIDWGEKLSASGDSISWSGRYSVYNKVYNQTKYSNADQYVYQYSFEVIDGDFIVIDDGSAIFTPYTGKPSLGFK